MPAKVAPPADIQDYLIGKANDSLKGGDPFMAKAWFLTGSALYPNAFAIQVSL